MKNLTLASVAAAALLTAVPAAAQTIPAAVVAVVDLDRVTRECTACKTANAILQSQVNALKTRQQALATPIEAEGKSLRAAVDALGGKEPDAALKTRIQAFQTRQQQGSQELSSREQQIQRNQTYISQQISAKLGPIYQQVMQRRGANIMVEVGNTLATANSVDVTADVLTALNTALPSVQTTAPAQSASQGR